MSINHRYFIPAKTIEVITEIKRSRFIARVSHSINTEHAFTLIKQSKTKFPDARHHCWAFIACPPAASTAIRFSDAGEPSGTAGKPILNVLQHSHYGEIVCVVSRYYGGIKLGAGGLVRAYSNSTKAALELLPVLEKVNLIPLTMEIPYAQENAIRHYLQMVKASIHHVQYQQRVIIDCDIAAERIAEIKLFCSNICKGDISILEQNAKQSVEQN